MGSTAFKISMILYETYALGLFDRFFDKNRLISIKNKMNYYFSFNKYKFVENFDAKYCIY